MNKKAIITRLAITILVTAGIFKISAGHIIEVAMRYGNDFQSAIVYPVAIDGMILVSAITMAASVGVSKEAKFWAKVGRYFGFAATVYANLVHSQWENLDAMAVNVIPAVALIIVMELSISSAKMTPAAKRTLKTKKA